MMIKATKEKPSRTDGTSPFEELDSFVVILRKKFDVNVKAIKIKKFVQAGKGTACLTQEQQATFEKSKKMRTSRG